MKTQLHTALAVLFCALFSLLQAQPTELPAIDLVASTPNENDADHPCISVEEYTRIEERCAENRTRYHIPTPTAQEKAIPVLLDWPLRATEALHDCSFYRVSAYVDHNANVGAITDFNCGNNTYDGHRGTDIATWPFNFYKMDNNLVEVIAAAPGIIVDKNDGEFDRNCSSNNFTANYVIVQQEDGSVILYWHMKQGFVTLKAIGETIEAGEYLGVVGSSGSSSGPHLHFEVWSGNTVATRVDPFSGTCNSLNATTWWNVQKPHKETSIVKASVHTTDIVLPPCPETETVNETAGFEIPFQGSGLPAGYGKFYSFIREEIAGLTAEMHILNPNGTTYLSWTYTSAADTKTRTIGWSKLLPTIPGTYLYEATYNGTTCSSSFEITEPAGIKEQQINSLNVFPNPSNGTFTVDLKKQPGNQFQVIDVFGKIIYETELNQQQTVIRLIADSGIYWCRLIANGQIIATNKLILH